MAEPKTKEWPLIVFTVGLQLAAGIELSAAVALSRSPGTAPLGVLAISVFPITAIAIVASLFHLGKPGSAWRAFANIAQSKLSREVAICSVFCTFAFLQFFFELVFRISSPAVHIVSAIFGIVAVVASARIYCIPGRLLWNSGWVTSSFTGSTLLLGGVVATLANVGKGSGIMIALGTVVLLASSTAMLIKIRQLARNRYASPASLPTMQAKHWLSFWGLIAGTIAPIVGLVASHSSVLVIIVTAVIAIVGVAVGRALMYSRGIALARF
jgi:anaerobic dimethyl sulfoxide reductase subunit C